MVRNIIKRTLGSRVAQHVYFWAALIALMLIEPPEEGIELGAHLARMALFISIALLGVYAHFWIFEKFLLSRRYLVYVPLTLVIVCVVGLLGNLAGRYLIDYVRSPFGTIMYVAYMVFFTSMICSGNRCPSRSCRGSKPASTHSSRLLYSTAKSSTFPFGNGAMS